MFIKTSLVRPIEWEEKDFEVIGTIGEKYRFCVIVPEYKVKESSPDDSDTVAKTGRWIVRYTIPNQNGKKYGHYTDSLEEAQNLAYRFLRTFVKQLLRGV